MTKNNITKTLVLFVIGLVMFSSVAFANVDTIDDDVKIIDVENNKIEIEDETDSNYGLSANYIDSNDFGRLNNNKFGVSAMTVSASSSGGAIQTPEIAQNFANKLFTSKEEYRPNLFTGSVSYSYPIEVPPGVNGLEPAIMLYYNHHNTMSFPGVVGTAWTLNTNYIYRDISYTRSDTSDDVFRINLNGVNSELVYVSSENKYHTEHESYMSVEKVSGGSNDKGDYWIVKTKEGTTYRFGYNTDSELVSNTENYVARWSLDLITDTHGNQIEYNYIENPSYNKGVAHLDTIKYNNGLNEIKFEYDYFFTEAWEIYYQGYEIKQSGILKNIIIKHNNALVRKYELSYNKNLNTNRVFLNEISEFGSDDSSSLPSTTFTYNDVTKGWTENANWKVPSEAYFGTDKDQGVRLVDKNGDGFVDVLAGKSGESLLKYFLNNGNGWDSTYSTYNNFIPDGFIDGFNRDRGVRFLDINGDTKIDALQLLSGQTTKRELRTNTGDAYSAESISGLPSDLSFVWTVAPQTCAPSGCGNGWSDNGVSCDDNYCTRTCSLSYYTCGSNWNAVFDDSGEGYSERYESEQDDDTRNYYAPSNTKCYKYYVDTPNSIRMRVDDDECFTGYDDDGDSVFIAGLHSYNSDDSWLSTVPPLSTYNGWYGEFEDPFDGADFDYSYLTSDEFNSDDFEDRDEEKFANDDNYIYCAPDAASCYFSNLDKPCGYGCHNQRTEAFVQSGYYYDAGNWLETIAYDEECDDEEVSRNRAKYIRLIVYEASATYQSETYKEYCERPTNFKDLGVRLVDVNGDGKTDILKGTSSERKTWINTGNGFVEDSNWQIPSDAYFITSDNKDRGIRLADINGDGMVDILKGYNSDIKTWINTGKGWAQRNSWNIPSGAVFVSSGVDQGVSLVDVNGDGLTDIVKAKDSTRTTWINTMNGWSADNSWAVPNGIVFTDYSSTITDVNGDGMNDLVMAKDSNNRKTWLNSASESYLLSSIKNKFGGTISLDYTNIPSLDNTGTDNIHDLSFSGWVVSSVTYNNGITGDHNIASTYTYDYSGGYFDSDDREFRGFNYVKETLPYGSIIKHWYYQDDAKASLEYETNILDSSGNILQKNEYAWGSETNNGYYIIKLNESIDYTFNGSSSDNPKIRKTTYEYDNYGNPTKTSYLGDNSITGDERYEHTEYLYNTNDWIVDRPKHNYLVDSDNSTKIRETWFSYDNQNYDSQPTDGDITKVESWLNTGNNPVTLYAYDSFGNLISETDPNSYTTQYQYDSTHTFAVAVVNAKNQKTDYEYDKKTGNMLSLKDPNNYVINYTYDVFGRLVKEILPYDNESLSTKEYEYSLDGSAPEKIKFKEKTESETLDSYYFYDGFGNLIQTKKEADNNKQIIVDIFYDDLNRVFKQTNPYFVSSTENYINPHSVGFTKYTYDSLGRVIKVKNPDDSTKRIVYNLWNIENYDENNNRKDYVKDAYDNIVEVREYNNNDVYVTTYNYTPAGELRLITDNQDNSISYVYDTLGRKISLVDPDLGTWSYEYDSVGNLIRQLDNKGNVVGMEYDELNRIKKKSTVDSIIIYNYDSGTVGKLSSIVSPDITTSYEYDQRLRNVKETKVIDGVSFVTVWAYDSMDRVVSKTLPNNEVITYTYDNGGNLDSIEDVIDDINYNQMFQPTKIDYSNSLQTVKTYDGLMYRLTNITTSDKQNLNYEYDDAGNVVGITDTKNNVIQNFEYDDLDRLTFTNSLGVNLTNYSTNYDYDSIGNLLDVKSSYNNITFLYSDSLVHTPSNVISVANVNLAPVLNPIENKTLDENSLIEFTISATDLNDDSLTYSATNLPQGATFDTQTQTFSWTPSHTQSGDYQVTFTVTDNNLDDSETITITVNNANRAPVIGTINNIAVDETQTITITASANDPDGDAITYSINDSRFSQDNNVFTWQTDHDDSGTYSVLVSVSDGQLGDSQAVTITVNDVNRAPVIGTINNIAVDETQTITITASANDPDENALTYSINDSRFSQDNNVFTWQTTYNDAGVYDVAVTASDNSLSDSETITITVNDMNRVPQITSTPIATATEDILYSYNVDATDPDGDTLTYSLVISPSGMGINSGTGLIEWTPTQDDIGEHNINISVTDGEFYTYQAYTLTVQDANDAPAVSNIPDIRFNEDESNSSLDLDDYVTDSDNIDAEITWLYSGNTNVNVNIDSSTHIVTLTSAADWNGQETITFTATDPGNLFDSDNTTVIVIPVNDTPVLEQIDDITVNENEEIVITALATDIDSQTLTYSINDSRFSQDNNVFTWQTDYDDSGVYDITVTVSDDSLSDSEQLTVTVNNANRAPQITSTPITEATEDILYSYDVSATDPDGDVLTYLLVTSPSEMTINSNGLIEWTPTQNDVGNHSVNVSVTGNNLYDYQSYILTVQAVNDAPVLASISDITVNENETVVITALATDIDSQTLTYSINDSRFSQDNNVFTWQTDYDDSGVYDITVTVSDDSLSDSEQLTVTVNNANRAPVLNSIGNKTVNENSLLEFTVSATDPDDDSLTYSATNLPNGATFNIPIKISTKTHNFINRAVFNTQTQTFSWAPSYAQSGDYDVTFTVIDNNLNDSETITITVNDVNRAPQITSTPIATATEDILYSYNVDATDQDGDTLTYSLVISPNGMTINSNTGVIEWTPTQSNVGSHNVNISATDSDLYTYQAYTLTVQDANDAPVVSDIPNINFNEDESDSIDLDDYVTDSDNTDSEITWTYSGNTNININIDAETHAVTFTASQNWNGQETITFTATDPGDLSDSDDTTIAVVPIVNTPPVLEQIDDITADEGETVTITATATDVDSETLTYSINDSRFTQNNNVFTWQTDYDDSGVYDITVTVSDDSLSDSEQLTVTVNNANRAPVLNSIGNKTVNENSLLEFTVSATDPDDDTLTYSTNTLPTGATFNSETQTFTWTPSHTQSESYQVIFNVSDGSLSDSETITITVEGINRAPVLNPIGDKTADEGLLLEFTVSATDPDDDSLTYSATNLPDGATFGTETRKFVKRHNLLKHVTFKTETKTFTWTPDYNQAGTYDVTFIVTDNNLNDSETITITVNDVNLNSAPQITSTPINGATEDILYAYDVDATDSDGDTLTYSLEENPVGMSIDSGTGLIQWTPTTAGVFSVNVSVNDGEFYVYQVFSISVTHDINIFDLTVDDVNAHSATISWQTDYVSNSTVLYSLSEQNLDYNIADYDTILSHEMSLSSLEQDSVYYYKVISCDVFDCDESNVNSFQTWLMGDLNSDEEVDISDVLRIVDIILEISPDPTDYELYVADLNYDESINNLDVAILVDTLSEIEREHIIINKFVSVDLTEYYGNLEDIPSEDSEYELRIIRDGKKVRASIYDGTLYLRSVEAGKDIVELELTAKYKNLVVGKKRLIFTLKIRQEIIRIDFPIFKFPIGDPDEKDEEPAEENSTEEEPEDEENIEDEVIEEEQEEEPTEPVEELTDEPVVPSAENPKKELPVILPIPIEDPEPIMPTVPDESVKKEPEPPVVLPVKDPVEKKSVPKPKKK